MSEVKEFERRYEADLIKAVRQYVPGLRKSEMSIDWKEMKFMVDGKHYEDSNFTADQLKKIHAVMWPDTIKKRRSTTPAPNHN